MNFFRKHWKSFGGIVVVILFIVVGYAVLQYQLSKPEPANNAITNTTPSTVADTVYIPFALGDIQLQRPNDYYVRTAVKNGIGAVLFEDRKGYVKFELHISNADTTIENYSYQNLKRVSFTTVGGKKAATFINEEGYADGPTQLTIQTPFIAYSVIHNGKVYDLVFNEFTAVDDRKLPILETFKFIR